MGNRAEIRGYAEADYEAFKLMFGEYFSSDLDTILTAEQLEEVCTDIAGQVRDGIGFLDLLMLDGEAKGFAEYQVDSPKSDWCEKEGFGCVREFYIARDCRKMGFGSLLAARAENRLRELEVPGIYLTSDDAAEFWLKMGYRDSGEVCAGNGTSIFIK